MAELVDPGCRSLLRAQAFVEDSWHHTNSVGLDIRRSKRRQPQLQEAAFGYPENALEALKSNISPRTKIAESRLQNQDCRFKVARHSARLSGEGDSVYLKVRGPMSPSKSTLRMQ